MIRSLTLVTVGRMQRQPSDAEGPHRNQHRQRQRRRDPRLAPARGAIDQHRGACEDRDSKECQSPQPDQRRRSAPAPAARSARSRTCSRGSRSIHGRAAIRPRSGDGERQHARGVAGPDQPRQRKAERGEQREIGRQAEHRERQQPCEGRGIDQEGIADPVQARHEITEAEPPAGPSPPTARRASARRPRRRSARP